MSASGCRALRWPVGRALELLVPDTSFAGRLNPVPIPKGWESAYQLRWQVGLPAMLVSEADSTLARKAGIWSAKLIRR